MVNGKQSTSYDPATFYEGKVQGIMHTLYNHETEVGVLISEMS